jgi:hypothetical protein
MRLLGYHASSPSREDKMQTLKTMKKRDERLDE